jgi:hypothetical protein
MSGKENSSGLEGVVIKVSVGIGHSLAEAEDSLARAKQRKPEARYYNIEMYSGESIPDPEKMESRAVKSYLDIEQRLSEIGDSESLHNLEVLKYDSMTGLLNRMGYEVEVARLKNKGEYENRVIILIDGDNMKRTNAELGYEGTDRYLVAIGSALKSQVRSNREAGSDAGKKGRDSDTKARNVDVLLNRKNDSGGDEFIVDIGCDYSNAEGIAMRYIDAMYAAQRSVVK